MSKRFAGWAVGARLLGHVAGALLVARLADWPPLLALAALLGVTGLSLEATVRPQSVAPGAAQSTHYGLRSSYFDLPLTLAYLAALLRLVIALIARADGLNLIALISPVSISSLSALLSALTEAPLNVPPPWGDWLNLNWAFALGALWAAALRLPAAWRGRAAAAGLAALAFGWAGFVYARSAPAGVTGSDPYAYVQMAVDLAERGTLLHQFPLAEAARERGLPLFPVVHVGYRLPNSENLSATVWPPGFAVLLAGAYRLAGERGLYLLNPLLGLLSLAATAWLALRLFPDHAGRWAAAGLAALWLATSPEQTTRLLVPLADTAAQLFTTLTLCLALGFSDYGLRLTDSDGRVARRAALAPFLLGLCFGWAYFTRYTQLLIAPGIVYLLVSSGNASRLGGDSHRRVRRPPVPEASQRYRIAAPSGERGVHLRLAAVYLPLALFALGALLVAVPDLAYHQQAFGSPFRVGSDELGLFRLGAAPGMAAQLAREVFASEEFLPALPFLVLGARLLWRRRRRELIALALAFGPLVLFHLPYPYLRARDLLSVFPALAVLGAVGAVEAAGWLSARSSAVRIATVALILAAPLARWHAAWPLARGFFTFGYLNAEQRAAFERLAALTSSGSVVAASLNSGAIDLYAGRATIRPATWSAGELEAFLEAMQADGREVYLFDDGVELSPVAARLRAEGRLAEAARLPGVYFGTTGGSENLDLTLYRVGG